jgi:hypothetical protein
MKKINLKTISKPLSNMEMKGIKGGGEDGGKSCIAQKSWADPDFKFTDEWSCFATAAEAIAYAGANGWWCCKCAEADRCASLA